MNAVCSTVLIQGCGSGLILAGSNLRGKKPDPDPTFEEKSDPDPTLEKQPGSGSYLISTYLTGLKSGFSDLIRLRLSVQKNLIHNQNHNKMNAEYLTNFENRIGIRLSDQNARIHNQKPS